MLGNKIKTFRPAITKGILIGYFFVALMGALPFFLMTIQKTGNIIFSIQMLIFFTIFFYFLFITFKFLDFKSSKSIIVFSNGISSFDKKENKRAEMTFNEMTKVKTVDIPFGDNYILVQSEYSAKELFIPYPIKNFDDFVNTVSNVAGENNVLVLNLNTIKKNTGDTGPAKAGSGPPAPESMR